MAEQPHPSHQKATYKGKNLLIDFIYFMSRQPPMRVEKLRFSSSETSKIKPLQIIYGILLKSQNVDADYI